MNAMSFRLRLTFSILAFPVIVWVLCCGGSW